MVKTRFLKHDWEFNVFGAYNYRKPGPLANYFDFVLENHMSIPGDLLEAGVFRGRSLIGMALMLKELGSDKIIYGFDTWSGFPPVYEEMDAFAQWERLHRSGSISDEHLRQVKLNQEYCTFGFKKSKELTAANVSRSGNFSDCSQEEIQARLDFLGLDNVRLIAGSFQDTMRADQFAGNRLMAVLIDADLYASYRVTLPFVWPLLSPGGYIFLDEYFSLKFPGARVATNEFFAERRDKPQRHKMVEGDFERWFVRKIHDGTP